MSGLPRRDPHRQGDPRARRRGVPQAAQHVPDPGGEPVRLRSGDRRVPRRRALEQVDRYMLSRYAEVALDARAGYDAFEFQRVATR